MWSVASLVLDYGENQPRDILKRRTLGITGAPLARKSRRSVITPGFIELNNKGRLIGNEYLDFEGIDQEYNNMGRMCNPYKGL